VSTKTGPTVALATSAAVPRLHAEDAVLVVALARLGIRGVPVVWDSPAGSRGGPVLIRSVWDYHLRLDEFLAWVARAGAAGAVWNAPAIVRWNAHKIYLRDLERSGIDVVPTLWIEPNASPDLGRELARLEWGELVVKPSVSASAHRTLRFAAGDHDAPAAHAARLARDGIAMVQPYLRSPGPSTERR